MDRIKNAQPSDNTSALPSLLGMPLNRVDGPKKVVGAALYAYEYVEGGEALYGVLVESSVAKGTLLKIDDSAALAFPGVKLVLSHNNAPRQASFKDDKTLPQFTRGNVRFHGEPVALVVADSFETARAAALSVVVTYKETKAIFSLSEVLESAVKPEAQNNIEPDSDVGHFDKAFADALVRIDATYQTPIHSHAMMEPHATLAYWQGNDLTVHMSSQLINQTQALLAATLLIPKEKVRVICPYIGGGFGSKQPGNAAEAVAAALASRILKRPVKVAMTRPQAFQSTSHRSATVQRVRLGADRDGMLSAIGHEAWSSNLPDAQFYEPAAVQTRSLYAGANRMTRHRLASLDITKSSHMRAPGESVGLIALEGAMDELAHELKMDPILLRKRNEPAEDPERHVPFSSRHLVNCMEEGARRFGWDKRPSVGERREGGFRIGFGMASAMRVNKLMPGQCAVRFGADGKLLVQMAMTDLGTGSYTIHTQIAADCLGLHPKDVTVLLGDTNFPYSSGSVGSWGANSSGAALFDACTNLRKKLADLAGVPEKESPFQDGALTSGGKVFSLRDLAREGPVNAKGDFKPDQNKKLSQASYGAHFAEVAVDETTGEIEVRRMLGVFSAGRIFNAKTARSQLIGAMIFGVGAALMEKIEVDPRYGSFVNRDLAEYHVPVAADIREIDAVLLSERDPETTPLEGKGLGELGICGSAAAIGNAVFNATGIRIRDFPLTLDKLLPSLSV